MNEAISTDSGLTGRKNTEMEARDWNPRCIGGEFGDLPYNGLCNCPDDLREVAMAAAGCCESLNWLCDSHCSLI